MRSVSNSKGNKFTISLLVPTAPNLHILRLLHWLLLDFVTLIIYNVCTSEISIFKLSPYPIKLWVFLLYIHTYFLNVTYTSVGLYEIGLQK